MTFRPPRSLRVLATAVAALGCAATPARNAAGDAVSDRRRSELLAHSLFLVAVPKDEDPAITYAQPLPVDQLPFRERTTNAIVRGTAFAIGGNRFVTAASVLPWVDIGSKRFCLVGAGGTTSEITRITRYSQYRNLVEFEVNVPPAGVISLELARDAARVGDTLTAVGNVAGDELVLPDSTVTALRPEEIAGAWQLISFTTAAALGTNGGPILDRAGRVVGVVIKAGARPDTLNDAVPIGQLDKMSTSSGEFWGKGATFGEDNRQIFSDWKFETPLPTVLPELWAAVARARVELHKKLMADFDAQHADEIFPREPNLEAFLRHPNVPYGFGTFAIDGNHRWSLTHETYARREISPGQFVSFAQKDRHAELLIDRPPGIPLLQFFQSPKALAETILEILGTKRSFAGQSIAMRSLGEPIEQKRWLDDLGRPSHDPTHLAGGSRS
jgi:serine protease Do